MKLKTLALLSAMALASPAYGEIVEFKVTDTAGVPLPNAVVMAEMPNQPTTPTSFDWPNEMSQQNVQFDPFVLVVPKGSEVEFPNRDRFRHHVYSFSRGNRFEIELYGREESRFVTFEKAGVVAVGCNIHDGMIGFIRVVDTPYAAKTDVDRCGNFRPAGRHSQFYHLASSHARERCFSILRCCRRRDRRSGIFAEYAV